ncbi:hypothetical protein PG993_008640 [Apiospora rasikravindrae]|uniref:Uncharacterized protein n=1 Tax=Apiospora rasikravindrae TaxID=990691 RepID=A0ABR1SQT2_9PEZI
MVVSHTLLLEKQVTTVIIETPESWFYFLVPSQHHWVIVAIHVRPACVPEVRGDELTLCDSWSRPCCEEAPENEEKAIRKFYHAHFQSGEWINAGHRRRGPSPNSGSECRQRRGEIESILPGEDVDESSTVDEPWRNDTASIERECATTNTAGGQHHSQRPDVIVNDLRGDTSASSASSAIQKFEKGMKKIARRNYWEGLAGARPSLPNRQNNLETAIHAISRIKTENKNLAMMEDWILDHLVRCLWVLQRKEHQAAPNMEERLRSERSAMMINKLVNAAAEVVGPLGLLVNSAYSVVGFRWSAAKVWADVDASIIVEQVCDGIFTKDIYVPESLHLFNPAAVLHRLLGRRYTDLCQDLGLESLSGHDPSIGVGQFQLIPLTQFQPQALGSSSKRRKRGGNTSQSVTRAPANLQGQAGAESDTYQDNIGYASGVAVPANTRTLLTDVNNMAFVPATQPAHSSDVGFGSIPNIFDDASALSLVPEWHDGFRWDFAVDMDESGMPFAIDSVW